MSHQHQNLGLIAGVMAVSLAACAKPDTVLIVQVEGNVAGIRQLDVEIEVGGEIHKLLVPGIPEAIALPTNFSVQVPRELGGALRITVSALGAEGESLGAGTSTFGQFYAGDKNEVMVTVKALEAAPAAEPGMPAPAP